MRGAPRSATLVSARLLAGLHPSGGATPQEACLLPVLDVLLKVHLFALHPNSIITLFVACLPGIAKFKDRTFVSSAGGQAGTPGKHPPNASWRCPCPPLLGTVRRRCWPMR